MGGVPSWTVNMKDQLRPLERNGKSPTSENPSRETASSHVKEVKVLPPVGYRTSIGWRLEVPRHIKRHRLSMSWDR